MSLISCPYCNNAWRVSQSIKKCPFCGRTLMPSDFMALEEAMDMFSLLDKLIDCYGQNVFTNRQKAISIMRDIAPQLDHEIRLFKLVLDSNIYNEFLYIKQTQRDGRREKLNRIRIILHDDCFLNENSIQTVIEWFSCIFDLENHRCSNAISKEKVLENKININTAGYDPDFDFISFHKGKEVSPQVFMLDDKRKVELFSNSTQFIKNVRITYCDGAVFLGTLYASNQFFEGLDGEFTWNNGDRFQGYLFFRKPIKGKYIWADGSSYNGTFKNGIISGNGTYACFNGTQYQGEFLKGRPINNGIYKFVNNQIYSIEGLFNENASFTPLLTIEELQENNISYQTRAHNHKNIITGIIGRGKITYADFNIYVGEIRNGQKHGEGILYISHGSSIGNEQLEGLWYNDNIKEYYSIKKRT